MAIAADAGGNAYVAGRTTSLDFPVTPATAFQPTKSTNNTVDASFVTRLNPAGSALVYSTYLGGGGTGTTARNYIGRLTNTDAALRELTTDTNGKITVATGASPGRDQVKANLSFSSRVSTVPLR